MLDPPVVQWIWPKILDHKLQRAPIDAMHEAGSRSSVTFAPKDRSSRAAAMEELACTTVSCSAGIGSTLKLLAENPDQFALVKANPALVKSAFEEALR